MDASLGVNGWVVTGASSGRIDGVTWGELIRRLKAAGYVEQRTGKGSHRQFVHSTTGKVITVSVHTKKEVGTGLAHRILKEAGL